MNALTTFQGTPEDLKAMLQEVIRPMAEELEQLRLQVGQHRHVLTTLEIAELTGFSQATVRDWIKAGRPVPGRTKREFLRVINGLDEAHHRIRYEEYQRFMSQFPDVRVR